jgi:hypothetical protein
MTDAVVAGVTTTIVAVAVVAVVVVVDGTTTGVAIAIMTETDAIMTVEDEEDTKIGGIESLKTAPEEYALLDTSFSLLNSRFLCICYRFSIIRTWQRDNMNGTKQKAESCH